MGMRGCAHSDLVPCFADVDPVPRSSFIVSNNVYVLCGLIICEDGQIAVRLSTFQL